MPSWEEGTLGLKIIRGFVCDPDFRKLTLILETPNDNEDNARGIALIKELCK
jgi:endonuclease IV